MLEGCSRNVNSLAGVVVNQDASFIERSGVIDGDDGEDLVEDVGVELFVSEDAFKSNCLGAFC